MAHTFLLYLYWNCTLLLLGSVYLSSCSELGSRIVQYTGETNCGLGGSNIHISGLIGLELVHAKGILVPAV